LKISFKQNVVQDVLCSSVNNTNILFYRD